MATTFLINGSVVDWTATSSLPQIPLASQLRMNFRGVDTFTFMVRGTVLPDPDPYIGSSIELDMSGGAIFSGNITARSDHHDDTLGWILTYQCYGLRRRGDWVSLIDPNTGLNNIVFNLQPDNPNFIAARAGRTVGQITQDILEYASNASQLAYWGIGNYTITDGVYALPYKTLLDLDSTWASIIPPFEVYVTGERLLSAIESFLAGVAPNTWMYVDPDGYIRFGDPRTFRNNVFTLDHDPIDPIAWNRDIGECFSAVQVVGSPLVVPVLVSLSNGGLLEDFAYPGFSNAAAKAAWTPSDYTSGISSDTGTCTCTSTTTVSVTSADPTRNWGGDFWDWTSSGAQGLLYLQSSSLGGALIQYTSRKILANTAMSPGGSSVLNLDYPLGSLTYDSYSIYGFGSAGGAGPDLVYRKYIVANPAIGQALTNQFLYPVPFVLASANTATLVSTPTAEVEYEGEGGPAGFVQDVTTGIITFIKPTALAFGSSSEPPDDVLVLLAVNQDVNQVFAPTTGFEGTCFTVDLASDVDNAKLLRITVPEWRDPSNLANMQVYAQEQLDSVKDTVIEGTIVWNGLYEDANSFGTAATVTGYSYSTGFESCSSFPCKGVPVVEVEIAWEQGTGNQYRTTLVVSNRRSAYQAGMFLKPSRIFVPITGTGLSQGIVSGFGSSASLNTMGLSQYQGLAAEGIVGQESNYNNAASLNPLTSGILKSQPSVSDAMSMGGSPESVSSIAGSADSMTPSPDDVTNQGMGLLKPHVTPTGEESQLLDRDLPNRPGAAEEISPDNSFFPDLSNR